MRAVLGLDTRASAEFVVIEPQMGLHFDNIGGLIDPAPRHGPENDNIGGHTEVS